MSYKSLHDRLAGPITKELSKKLKQKNIYALPRIEKVIVSTGINKSKMDGKEVRAYVEDSLAKITGQKPVFTKAKQAISNFKTREGMIVGAMVTLRGKKMEEFLDRLLSFVIPRIRDFRGLPTNFDGQGNYAIGIRDHSIFPEVPPPDAKQIFGLQIQITTTTNDDEEARALLKEMGMPFRPEKKSEEAAESKKQEEEEMKRKAEAEASAEAEAEKNDDSVDETSNTPDTEASD